MFTDLRGFTTFAESLTPDRVIEVLNRYLSEMSDAILDHGGHARGLHGRRDHGRVRRADRPGRPRRPCALRRRARCSTVRLPRFNAWLHEQELGDRAFAWASA